MNWAHIAALAGGIAAAYVLAFLLIVWPLLADAKGAGK